MQSSSTAKPLRCRSPASSTLRRTCAAGKEADKAQAEIAKVEGKFANAAFMAKAPPEVIEENQERKATFTTQIEKLTAALARLDAMG